MESLRGNEEDHGSDNSPSPSKWKAAKKNIEYLYFSRNLPLSKVVEEMEKLGFSASQKMYKARLATWEMGKNASRQDWLAFAKIYEQRRAAGIADTLVRIHNKIRRIQDLNKYLKSHGEREETFFAEAVASQVPIPRYVYCCNPDGSKAMYPEDTEQPRQVDFDISKDGILGPLASQPPCVFTPSQQLNSLTQGGPLFDMNIPFDQLDSPEVAAALAEMSDLSSFQSIHSGNIIQLYHNAYGGGPQLYDQGDDSPRSLSAASFVSPQPPGPTLNHSDGHNSYMTACMVACMFGAAGKKDSMNQCLQRASAAFRQMCVLQSPFILTAATWILTWLLVHAEGSLSERVMRLSFDVATETLGGENFVCVLLEWMTTAVVASKLRACLIDSARLRQVWQAFNQVLGAEHGHTIVALYCLSFHLMFVNKDFAQAEQYLSNLCVVSTHVFGPYHVQTINILATLSRAQHRQKKYLAALETITKSLTAAPLGLNHPHRLELLLRKALIVWKLNRMDEMEELYWVVVKGRVATLGIHHKTTIAAHNSLVDVLHWNNNWEAKKDDAHRLLLDPQVSVSDYESWWRRVVEANRPDKCQDSSSSDEEE